MNNRFFFSIFLLASFCFIACRKNAKPKDNVKNKVSTLDEVARKVYLKKGKDIAAETFGTLAGQLQQSLADGGIQNAIAYCNLAAFPLVDSLSKKHDVIIKRTSLNVRNPKNKPTPLERNMLEAYESQAKNHKELLPLIHQIDVENIAFFAPIKVNAFCLQCHGKLGDSMTKENYKIIKASYPQDNAIGYIDGDLRGMWSIHYLINNNK